MRRLGAVLAAACIALAPVPARAAGIAWEQWKAIPGALDVDGVRSDGSLIVAGSGALYLVDPNGAVTDFARGPGGYHEDKGMEAYLAMSPGGHVSAAACDFVRDETFLLRMHIPFGVNRVSASGDESGSFANLTGVAALTGIAFDTVGAFDHRLLVMGVSGKKGTIFAVDCNGDVQVITHSAPFLEGGIAVAPKGFGQFEGDLIVPAELSGRIYAFRPDGTVQTVLNPPLPAGVEALGGIGFVPFGFMSRGGAAYHADHKTAGSSFPGTDSLLRLTSAQLLDAGVQDGDLLAAGESGGALIAVRCEASCTARRLVGPTMAHAEGHIAFTMEALPSSPSPSAPSATGGGGPTLPPELVVFVGDWGIPSVALALLVALLAILGVQGIRRRGR